MDRGEGDVPDGDVVLFPIDVGLGVLREGLNGTEAGHLAEEVEGLDLGMRSVRGAYLLVVGIEPLLGLLLVGGKNGEGGEELLEVDLVVLVDGASLVEDASEGGGDDGEEGAEGGEDAVVDAGDVGVEDAVGGLVDVEAVGAAGDVEDHVLLGGDLRGGGEGGSTYLEVEEIAEELSGLLGRVPDVEGAAVHEGVLLVLAGVLLEEAVDLKEVLEVDVVGEELLLDGGGELSVVLELVLGELDLFEGGLLDLFALLELGGGLLDLLLEDLEDLGEVVVLVLEELANEGGLVGEDANEVGNVLLDGVGVVLVVDDVEDASVGQALQDVEGDGVGIDGVEVVAVLIEEMVVGVGGESEVGLESLLEAVDGLFGVDHEVVGLIQGTINVDGDLLAGLGLFGLGLGGLFSLFFGHDAGSSETARNW